MFRKIIERIVPTPVNAIIDKLEDAFVLYEQGKKKEAEESVIELLAVHWEAFYKAAYSETDVFPEQKPHYLAIAKHLHAMVARKGNQDAMSKAHWFESEQARPQTISFTTEEEHVLNASKDRKAWHLFYRLGNAYKHTADLTSQSKSNDFFKVGFHLCSRAAIMGYDTGMGDLGTTYLDGLAGQEKNLLAAVKWLTPLADKYGLSAFELARAYRELGDLKQQKVHLEKSLKILTPKDTSYGEARIELAKLYIYGIDGQSDLPKAISLLEEILQKKKEDVEINRAKCWLAILYTKIDIKVDSAVAYINSASPKSREKMEKELLPEASDTSVAKEVKVQLQAVLTQLKDNLFPALSLESWKNYTKQDAKNNGELIPLLTSKSATQQYNGRNAL